MLYFSCLCLNDSTAWRLGARLLWKNATICLPFFCMLKCLERHMTEIFHFILLHNFCEVNMEINLQFLWFFVILYIVVWEKFTKAGCWNKLHRILRTEFFRSVQIHKQTSTMEFIKSVVSPYKIAVGSGSSPDPTAQTGKKPVTVKIRMTGEGIRYRTKVTFHVILSDSEGSSQYR